jgi:hypothetical protein
MAKTAREILKEFNKEHYPKKVRITIEEIL